MGIREIGKQGEPYDPAVEDLIRSVKAMNPKLPISVDGGVSAQVIPALVEAGVSQLTVGSALFHGDIERNFSALVAARDA